MEYFKIDSNDLRLHFGRKMTVGGYFKSAVKDRILLCGEVANRDYHGFHYDPTQGRCGDCSVR